MTVIEMRRLRAGKLAEAKKIVDASDSEKRSLTEEEETKFNTLVTEADSLATQIAHRDLWDNKIAKFDTESRESAGRETDDLPHNDPVATRNNRHQYSILKAIRETYLHRSGQNPKGVTGLELEVHVELEKRRVRDGLEPSKGILIPWDLKVDPRAAQRAADAAGLERRAMDTTAGAGSIPTILDGTMIDYLRARMVTAGLGARVMSGMQGLFAIPRQNTTGTFYMVGQASSVTGSNATIDQVSFAPHTGGGYTDYTRRFAEQTNLDAEQFIRDDLAAVVARGIETQALNGSGSSFNLLGLLQNPNIQIEAIGTNGGAPSWDNLVNMESKVAIANADFGNLAYLTDAAVRGKLKRTAKIGSTFPIYLWDGSSPGSPLNSYPCAVTNLMPSNLTKGSGSSLHAMIYGNWQDLIYAFWSGLDVLVDPYTGGTSGTIRIVALQDFDANIRHPESFVNCLDIAVT